VIVANYSGNIVVLEKIMMVALGKQTSGSALWKGK
jgi:hypothetical protein